MSNNNVREYVETLDETTIVSIVDSYEQFERLGHIGDEPIRQHAERYLSVNGISGGNLIGTWMMILAMECYRNLTRRHYP